MDKITDQEAIDAGLPKKLMQEWADVMQHLWTLSIRLFKENKQSVHFLPKQGENEITIGDRFMIRVLFCNKTYLDVLVYDNEDKFLEIKHFNIRATVELVLTAVTQKVAQW